MPHFAYAPEYVYPSARDRYLYALAQEQAAAEREEAQRRHAGMHRHSYPVHQHAHGHHGFAQAQPRCQSFDRRERGGEGYWDSLHHRQAQAEQIQRQRDAVNDARRRTPPTQPQPNRERRRSQESPEPIRIPITTPEESSTKVAADAASVIQSQWRAYKDRKQAFSTISALASTLSTLKSAFSFPAHLDFAPNATESSPILTFNQHNVPVLEYEHQLTKLLSQLDAIDSKGLESVRNARKALVREVEAELERLDALRVEEWRKQFAAEVIPAAEGPSVASEEVEFVVPAPAIHVDTPAFESDVVTDVVGEPAEPVPVIEDTSVSILASRDDAPVHDDTTVDDDEDFRMQDMATSTIITAPELVPLPESDDVDSPTTPTRRSRSGSESTVTGHVGFLESMEPIPVRFPSPTLSSTESSASTSEENDVDEMVLVEKMVDEPQSATDDFVMV